ncbi:MULTISPECIES: hypothetical protein [Sinorhizobium]
MDFAQPLSVDPLGSDALEMMERALHAELLGAHCHASQKKLKRSPWS